MNDYQTDSFGFSYSAENIPKPHQLPGGAFADGTLFQPNFNFGNPEVLDKLYAQQLSYRDIFAQFDALPKGQQRLRLVAFFRLSTCAFYLFS